MSFKLNPIRVRAETYSFQTDMPREHITERLMLREIKYHNMNVGDPFLVQVMASGYDHGEGTGTLLYEADYRVTEKKAVLKTDNPDGHKPHTHDDMEFVIECVDKDGIQWHAFAAAREAEELERLLAGQAATDPPLDRRHVWNIGRRVHEVFSGDEIIFESKDKAEAQAVADGGPIPVVA